ncbi:MAG: hypothetical protein B7733_12940 [Myxococcales bacterium FL481]|nr:MAG: hypothetical protein B7733_12940 [Myxococcales bacterium FL481]
MGVNMGTELAMTSDPTPMQIIRSLVENDAVDTDKLKSLMDLQHEWELRQARKGYAEALTRFQSECPPITKLKAADRYKYAPFEDIMRTIRPHLQDAGLSVSFSCEQVDGKLQTTCYIQHGIHREEHTVTLPVPEMRVNATQQMGAAISYGKRYALTAALNIVVEDEDTDARNLGPVATITEDEAIELQEWMESLDVDPSRLTSHYGIERIIDLPRAKLSHARSNLKKIEDKR